MIIDVCVEQAGVELKRPLQRLYGRIQIADGEIVETEIVPSLGRARAGDEGFLQRFNGRRIISASLHIAVG